MAPEILQNPFLTRQLIRTCTTDPLTLAAGERLRHDAVPLAAIVSCPGADPATVARGLAAIRAAMVLTDLLARADA